MSGNASLNSFAQEHGTTDTIREEPKQEPEGTVADNIPSPEPPIEGAVDEEYIYPDRHVALNRVPKYWQDNGETWNLIPKGEFAVIFDETNCQHGWPVETELQPGVYLRGKHQTHPPAPVEVSDELLRGAATTAIQAVHKIVSEFDVTDAPVIGLTKECETSLSVYLDTDVEPRQRAVYNSASPEQSPLPPTIPSTEHSPPLFHGFTHIRLFHKGKKGHEVYVRAEKPRLSVADVGWTKTVNRSL